MELEPIHIYVDTNVLINYCTNQKKDVDALNYVFKKRRKEVLFTSSLAVVQTVTNLQTKKSKRKAFTKDEVFNILDKLLSKFTIIDLTLDDIDKSRNENGNDVEDCVHAVLSKKKKCFAILTNNISDFSSFKDICILPISLGYLKTVVK
jgi:predicted nucleic acid-binding protein